MFDSDTSRRDSRLCALLGQEQFLSLLCVEHYLYPEKRNLNECTHLKDLLAELDWVKFENVVADNKLWTIVNKTVEELVISLNLNVIISSDSLSEWKKKTLSNQHRNKIARAELIELADSLRINRINSVVLKGGIRLIDNLWPALSDRYLGDFDILIPSEQALEAGNVLQSMGYEYIKEPRLDKSFHHLPELVHPMKIMPVELHHEVAIKRLQTVLSSDNFFKNQFTIPAGDGLGVSVPGYDNQIQHGFNHASLFLANDHRKYFPLLDLFEISLLRKKQEIERPESNRKGRFFLLDAFEIVSREYDNDLVFQKPPGRLRKSLARNYIRAKKFFSWDREEGLLTTFFNSLVTAVFILTVHFNRVKIKLLTICRRVEKSAP